MIFFTYDLSVMFPVVCGDWNRDGQREGGAGAEGMPPN